MFSILFAKVFMFFVILNLNCLVRAGSGDVLKDDNIDRGSRSDRGGLWFGPRLGKRSFRLASDGDDKGQVQAFLRLLEAADAVKYYYDQMPYYDPRADDPDMTVTKKVIFTPKLGRSLSKYDDKRFESDFTPRLGRGLAPQSNPEESYQEQTEDRIRYFSPRLGRNGVNFSPRLGRDIAYDHYPQNLRVVRSTNGNKTKSD